MIEGIDQSQPRSEMNSEAGVGLRKSNGCVFVGDNIREVWANGKCVPIADLVNLEVQ